MVDNVRLPVNIEQGARGGPRFKTVIQVSLSGKEQRLAEWDQARCEFDIQYGIRDLEDIREVRDFFRSRMGPLYPFRFKDWSDFESDGVQSLGNGDGTTAAFQLVKTYTDTVQDHVRLIQLPISGTLTVKVGGVTKTETTHYTVNYQTGVITFTGGNIPPSTSPPTEVTAEFEFDVPCRFADDDLEIRVERADENGDVLIRTGSIKIVEVLGE